MVGAYGQGPMHQYLTVRTKFLTALVVSTAWMSLSIALSWPWIMDLSTHIGLFLAVYFVVFIAIVPGFINAFVVTAMALDKRPKRQQPSEYPSLTILVPAYNEETVIEDTLTSLIRQDYPAPLRILVINDGSTDGTARVVRQLQPQSAQLELINLDQNIGKAEALNLGLAETTTELVVTVDADCWIRADGIRHLAERYLSDPITTKAVAGTILIRNSRANWLTKAQEWDYFLGIAAIKRIQSLFQGTLVAQGAFSIYDKQAVLEVGGWPETVGEDIVLTWRLLAKGHRIGHASDACAFTLCPTTLGQFIRQRQRWSRGLIEAFKDSPRLIIKGRFSSLFIVWNAIFPLMDIAYTFGFIPGLIMACFGHYWIVGPMTLALIPPAIIFNQVMYRSEVKMFAAEHMTIRKNRLGFLTYTVLYSLILQPACVYGYFSEIFRFNKTWGTK